jgi:hypothetical protein
MLALPFSITMPSGIPPNRVLRRKVQTVKKYTPGRE